MCGGGGGGGGGDLHHTPCFKSSHSKSLCLFGLLRVHVSGVHVVVETG